MEDEQTWKIQLESTTDKQWDQMAQMVRNEINTGDITPITDLFPPHSECCRINLDDLVINGEVALFWNKFY